MAFREDLVRAPLAVGSSVARLALALLLVQGCVVPEDLLLDRPCECGEGWYCREPERVCVRGTAPDAGSPSDAGPDAAVADGGRDASIGVDSGPPDAGTDAGMRDGGALDGGADAGPLVLPDLVARYDCDSLVAGVLADRTGNGHDARCGSGECPTLVASDRGSACSFDGADDHLTVTYAAALDPSMPFSVVVWARAADDGDGQSVIAIPWGAEYLNSYQLYLPAGVTAGMVEPRFVSTDGISTLSARGPEVPAAEWHHFVFSFDGSRKHLWVDGALVDVDTDETIVADGQDIVIGGDRNAGAFIYPFDGELDELELYSRALAPGEVAMLLAR